MPQLQRIKIEGYRSIESLDLDLRDINVLIGPNAAGKSNFISFFRLLRQLANESLQVYAQRAGGPDTIFYYGQKVTSRLNCTLNLDEHEYLFKLIPTEDGRLVFGQERVSPQEESGTETSRLIGEGHAESNLALSERNVWTSAPGSIRDGINGLGVYHFQDTGPSAPPKQAVNIQDDRRLHSDAGNLAAVLYRLKEQRPDAYRLIRRTVQRVFPQFGDFVLRPDTHNEDTIRLQWREKGEEYVFGAHQLSDGTLRFICLATLFLQPDPPATIIVDEPELGLHPYALGVLAGMVRSAAADAQVILSTQSVTLLNQFAPEDVIVVEREEDPDAPVEAPRSHSTFRRVSDQEELDAWLEDYTLGDLWEMNVLGGRP
jgi:predicted ATPase